ncbi:CBY1-interacting BAR domain-containing protein 1-like isoform X2 [Ostrea edulis]|uniref:CBY1-interacting BAR domain-containing protein 1-like isoform X2 n=1 Tax=Ostrea edulis TaxID=37623 RepID=UPI0024AF7316|nr:CBY1-interacting BAR domain-containing protein 1-like isoform X2 [Ostrea edulis]
MSRTGAEIRASKQKPSQGSWIKRMMGNDSKAQTRETKAKQIQERISQVERHFGQLCDDMASYTRKCARLRDKGDQIAKDLVDYTEAETSNPSMVRSLSEFASNLATVQDYRQAQVTRLESKVLTPLANYGLKCKHAKNDIKEGVKTQDLELNTRKKLDRLRQKSPADRAQLTMAETELQKASVKASAVTKNLEQLIDKFEEEKLKDLKRVLTDFVNIEMIYHAKALEMYTECFQNIKTFDVEEDIEEFRSKMQPSNSANRMNMVRSSSYTSLESADDQRITSNIRRQQSAPSSRNVTPTKSANNSALTSPLRATSDSRNGLDNEETEEEEDEEEESEEDDDDDDDDDDEYTETETARTETARSTARTDKPKVQSERTVIKPPSSLIKKVSQ